METKNEIKNTNIRSNYQAVRPDYCKNLIIYNDTISSNKLKYKLRRLIHPLLLKEITKTKKYNLINVNECPKVNGPVLYAVNHTNKSDAPMISSAVKNHNYFLIGKQRLEIIDKIFFFLNGRIYVDRNNSQNRHEAKEKIIKLLNDGISLIMFPEGTWNTKESTPMLPMNWGIIDISHDASVPIIPVMMEYIEDNCYVKFGDPIHIESNFDKSNEITKLRDKMATLKWNIWESMPIQLRENIDNDAHSKMIQHYISEYPKLDTDLEKSIVRKEYDTSDEVFEPINILVSKRKGSK